MRSPTITDPEQLLKNLVHDLRQPLGTIETSVYLLLRTADPEARAQIRAIEHQVERAAALLTEAAAELNRRHAAM
jgi:signal transduction histidine kinase